MPPISDQGNIPRLGMLMSILSIRWHPCRGYNIQDTKKGKGVTVFHLPPALAACPEATLRKPMLTAAAIMDIIP
jgi:hypothetical protein